MSGTGIRILEAVARILDTVAGIFDTVVRIPGTVIRILRATGITGVRVCRTGIVVNSGRAAF